MSTSQPIPVAHGLTNISYALQSITTTVCDNDELSSQETLKIMTWKLQPETDPSLEAGLLTEAIPFP